MEKVLVTPIAFSNGFPLFCFLKMCVLPIGHKPDRWVLLFLLLLPLLLTHNDNNNDNDDASINDEPGLADEEGVAGARAAGRAGCAEGG